MSVLGLGTSKVSGESWKSEAACSSPQRPETGCGHRLTFTSGCPARAIVSWARDLCLLTVRLVRLDLWAANRTCRGCEMSRG